MTDIPTALDRDRVRRRVGNPWLGDLLAKPGTLAWGLCTVVVGGMVYPATLLFSLPVLLFWSLVTVLDDRWQMPMRMPTDMTRDDPSTAR